MTDLQRGVNSGERGLLNLRRALARGKLRLQTFLRLFGDIFVVQSGRVRLKTQAPAPAAPAESDADRRYREFKEREARQEAARQARAAAARASIGGLEGVYGRGR